METPDYETWVKNECFEKSFMTMQQILYPIKLQKKTRIVIDYDPENGDTTIQYYYLEKQKLEP